MSGSQYDGDDVNIKGIPTKTSDPSDTSEVITFTEDGATRRRLDVAPSNFFIDISTGVGANDGVNVSAYTTNLASSERSIWHYGSLYVFPTTASTLSVVSDDNDDATGGTGARTVFLEGLDVNYNPISETINMNGTTPVITTNSYLRFQSATVLTAGSSGHNEGVISFTHGSDVIGAISGTNNLSLQSVYTVPAGKQAILLTGSAALESGKSATIKFKVRPFGGVFLDVLILEIASGGFALTLPTAEPFGEKTDFVLNAKLNTGTAAMGAFYSLVLVDL